jgi:hypothetical protein
MTLQGDVAPLCPRGVPVGFHGSGHIVRVAQPERLESLHFLHLKRTEPCVTGQAPPELL